jgi:hypothetical protein
MRMTLSVGVLAAATAAPLHAQYVEKAQFATSCRDRPKGISDPDRKVDGFLFALEVKRPPAVREYVVAAYPQIRLKGEWVYLVCRPEPAYTPYRSVRRENKGPVYRGRAANDAAYQLTEEETAIAFFIPHEAVSLDGTGLEPQKRTEVEMRLEVLILTPVNQTLQEVGVATSDPFMTGITPRRKGGGTPFERFKQDEGPFKTLVFKK